MKKLIALLLTLVMVFTLAACGGAAAPAPEAAPEAEPVVSDSGTLPEESSFFLSVDNPFPAVCIRTSTERPEALDKGNFVLAGITTEQVLQAVDTAVAMNEAGDYGIPVPDYVEENVSTKVVKLIQSYTGVVNKMVWRKY